MMKLLYFFNQVRYSEEGMGVIEVAIIVVILIGLAILFRGAANAELKKLIEAMNVDQIISGQ